MKTDTGRWALDLGEGGCYEIYTTQEMREMFAKRYREYKGKFYVLEVNPRFGGAYPHTHSCGMNYVRMIANNAIGIKNEPFKMEYEDDIVAFRYMTISTMKRKDTDDE